MPQITAQNLAVICCTVARQKSFITFGPRSLLSKSIGPDEIGKVFSILAVLASLGPDAGNAMFRQLYNNTIATFPGSIFLLGASLLFLTAGVNVFIWTQRSKLQYVPDERELASIVQQGDGKIYTLDVADIQTQL